MASPEVSRRFPVLFLLTAFAFAGLLLVAAWLLWPKVPELPEYGSMPRFALTDQDGKTVQSEALQGKVLVVNFIYTSCTDICPMLTAKMAQFQEVLAAEGYLGRDVALLSISVDPERDTPEVLKAYAERHGAETGSWRFLTGPVAEVRGTVVEGFLVAMDKVPAPEGASGHGHTGAAADSYEVSHSGRVVLVDRQGRIRAYYDGETVNPGEMLRDVRLLLR